MSIEGGNGAGPAESPRWIEALFNSRRSVRGFLDTPVALSDVSEILRIASRAASGGNIQPWRVHILSGDARARLVTAIMEARSTQRCEPEPEYHYPVPSIEPYRSRTRAVGADLYRALGVARDDLDGRMFQLNRNFEFFGAPIGLIFTVDRRLGQGAYLELGIFLQSVMIVARALGLDTCPQAAIAWHHAVIRRELVLSDEEMVMCGMALGHADPDHPANNFTTHREPVESFTVFHGE